MIQDCDFKVQSGRPPVKSMKEAMARLDPDKKFIERAQDFVYIVPSGKEVGVDAVDSASVSSDSYLYSGIQKV